MQEFGYYACHDLNQPHEADYAKYLVLNGFSVVREAEVKHLFPEFPDGGKRDPNGDRHRAFFDRMEEALKPYGYRVILVEDVASFREDITLYLKEKKARKAQFYQDTFEELGLHNHSQQERIQNIVGQLAHILHFSELFKIISDLVALIKEIEVSK